MRLRGEMELSGGGAMKNINDVKECPKCGREEFDLRYDPVFDDIKVACSVCGYMFNCAPADKAARGPAGSAEAEPDPPVAMGD